MENFGLNKETAEKVIETVQVFFEEDHSLKFARIDLTDFDKPIFKKLNWNERIVYWVLWFRSNDSKQETWMSNEKIAKDARMEPRAVKDIIPRLEQKKFITKRHSATKRRVVKCLVSLTTPK